MNLNIPCRRNAYYFIVIGIQPLGQFGQRPELGQATRVALVSCILGKFLGAGCHYFPQLFFRLSHFRHKVPLRRKAYVIVFMVIGSL